MQQIFASNSFFSTQLLHEIRSYLDLAFMSILTSAMS